MKKSLFFVICFSSSLLYGGRLKNFINRCYAKFHPKNTVGQEYILYPDEQPAPAIYKRLLDHGLQKFHAPIVEIAQSKITKRSDLASTSVLGTFFYTPLLGITFTPNTHIKIYVTPTLNGLPYPCKKATIFHEIAHTLQPIKENKFVPLNSSKYSHVEQEADSEAISHISCFQCAHVAAIGATLKDTDKTPIGRLLSWFGLKDQQNLLDRGYLDYETAKKLADKKIETCPYHQELNNNIIYQLSNMISPLTALGCYSLLKREDKPLDKKRASLIMLSVLFAEELENYIQANIAKKVENKVASGELEP